ncbi:MAG: TolC family protein, partial [Pseudobdellovibrionaceae bacterium]
FLVLPILFLDSFASAIPLKEAIEQTLSNHPDVAAVEKRIAAAQKRIEANRLDFLPAIGVSGSFGTSNVSGSSGPDYGRAASSSYGLTLPIFDGGVTLFSYRASKAQKSIVEEDARSISNELADQTAMTYVNLLQARDQMIFLDKIRGKLEKLKNRSAERTRMNYDPAKASSEAALIENALSGNENLRIESDSLKDQTQDIYKKLLGVMPDGFLEEMDTISNQYEIPETADLAIETGLRMSPRIRSIDQAIKKSKNVMNAEDGRNFLPSVDGYVERSNNDRIYDSNGYSYGETTSVGIRLNLRLNAGSIPRHQAAKLDIEALYKEKDSVILDLETDMKIAYRQISNSIKAEKNQATAYANSNAACLEIIRKIEAHEEVDILAAVQVFNDVTNNYYRLYHTRKALLISKFKVLKGMGTLVKAAQR